MKLLLHSFQSNISDWGMHKPMAARCSEVNAIHLTEMIAQAYTGKRKDKLKTKHVDFSHAGWLTLPVFLVSLLGRRGKLFLELMAYIQVFRNIQFALLASQLDNWLAMFSAMMFIHLFKCLPCSILKP